VISVISVISVVKIAVQQPIFTAFSDARPTTTKFFHEPLVGVLPAPRCMADGAHSGRLRGQISRILENRRY
jgi:hypothetical protein